jgi:hypothetical protein
VKIENKDDVYNFIKEIQDNIKINFIDKLRLKDNSGFRWTIAGDLFKVGKKCGSPQAAFTLRIMKILNILDKDDEKIIFNRLLNTHNTNNTYTDKCVTFSSIPSRIYQFIKTRNIDHIYNKFNQRAQTRQVIAALVNLNKKPENIYLPIDPTSESVSKFLHNLNWNNPWGAASHLNGLIFFIKYSSLIDSKKNELYDAIENTLRLYLNEDGSFSKAGKSLSLEEKVGSFMKIIMAFSLIDRHNDWINNNMIDISLEFSNSLCNKDACKSFNTLYVLSKCAKLGYKTTEIETFIIQEVNMIQQYYYEEYSAFSFYKNKSQIRFHFGFITKGLNEPDLHGTAMYVWALYLIAEALGIHKELELNEVAL